ncbi:carbohydrate kinase family protein [Rhodococcus jostii]|uniref:carbohydrate kinase family protein n=1 Tax=Rhodococcus jostii TaxID=132919 RepID=UPI0002EDCBFD|nr:PfkB family carbohydrate kinase [Rhodococcus jostii]
MPEALSYFEAALPHIDYFLPNDEQVIGWTGASSVEDGCRRLLDRGAQCAVVTAGPNPTVVATEYGITEVPAFTVDVVNTTGCGDVFSAGFLRGVSLGMDPAAAARLGNATAAQVAQGLGSDFGDYDLDVVKRFSSSHTAREVR